MIAEDFNLDFFMHKWSFVHEFMLYNCANASYVYRILAAENIIY